MNARFFRKCVVLQNGFPDMLQTGIEKFSKILDKKLVYYAKDITNEEITDEGSLQVLLQFSPLKESVST